MEYYNRMKPFAKLSVQMQVNLNQNGKTLLAAVNLKYYLVMSLNNMSLLSALNIVDPSMLNRKRC